MKTSHMWRYPKLEGRFGTVASGPKMSVALSDRPVALLVVSLAGWHAVVSHTVRTE